MFNYGRNITLLTNIYDDDEDTTEPQLGATALAWQADFTRGQLEPGWYHKSMLDISLPLTMVLQSNRVDTPLKVFYSLQDRPGCLRIYGGCYSLSSPEAPTMLLRKQTDLCQTFKATLDFVPKKAGYEAGIVIWWSMYSYASIGITADGRGNSKAVIKVAKEGTVREVVGYPSMIQYRANH